jgi:bifunctional DNase/RNase
MDVVGVRLEVPANTPVMMLREQQAPGRLLPIYIGGPEASAIHFALEGLVPPRPLTHDLMVTVLDALGASLQRVVISEMREHTFYAELHLQQHGDSLVVSARPSDAVALAVRLQTPIFASEAVLDEAGQMPTADQADEGGDADEILDEFRDFIEHVNPEDFAGS